MLCFWISYSSQLLKIFIKEKKKKKDFVQKLQLERDIKSMCSRHFLELHTDTQPSLLHFLYFLFN